MPIRKDKQEELHRRMEDLGIKEVDLLEKFILGSGRGGQKLQKTYSCVYLKHLPTGIEVKCQKDRSREINRFLARRALCDLLSEKPTKKELQTEKIRKQKKRRARRRKEKDEGQTP